MTRITHIARRAASALLGVISPDVCYLCGSRLVVGERYICMGCNISLPDPKLYHHPADNFLTEKFASTVFDFRKAVGLLDYTAGGAVSHLIVTSKFNNRPGMARHMMRQRLKLLTSSGFFDGIDVICPIPSHIFKYMRRGFNLAAELASEVAEASGLPVVRNLKMRLSHSAQVGKGREARLANARGAFYVRNAPQLQGKHILIVDDVVTTGATITAAINTLNQAAPGTAYSVLTLGVTRN